MKISTLFIMVLFVAGVMASLPDCSTPDYDAFNSRYDFIDGWNNSYDPAASTSWNMSGSNATSQALMGATGMNFVLGVKYHESDDDRGLGYIFYDPSTTFYYGVVQWNGEAWGIPGLERVTYAGGYRYENSDTGATAVIISEGTEQTFTVLRRAYCSSNDTYIERYSFGNQSYRMNYYDADSAVWRAEVAYTHEGNFDTNPAADWDCDVVNNRLYAGWHTRDATPPTNQHNYGFIGVGSSEYNYLPDYYSCGDQTGNVTFIAYEGSEACGIAGNSPDVTCTIEGDSIVIPASNVSSATFNTTSPTFVDVQDVGNGDYFVHAYDSSGTFKTTEQPFTSFRFSKLKESESQLTIEPLTAGDNQLLDAHGAYIIRYASPTGSVDDITLSSVFFNTSFRPALPCETSLIWGDDNYTLSLLVGINSTTYKKTSYTCDHGTTSVLIEYNNTLDNLLNTEEEYYIDKLELTTEGGSDSVWKDEEANSLNRLFYLNLDFTPTQTRARYDFDLSIGDNEQFILSYADDNVTINSNTTDAYAFGEYFYQCTAPTGYVFVNETGSGFITIDESFEFVNVIVQNETEIDLAITIKKQFVPIASVVCRASTGQVASSDSDGICTLENVPTNTNITVSFQKGLDIVTGVFPTGDYYNSEGYGVGQQCKDFDGTYEYTIDIENDYQTLSVTVASKTTGNPIESATIYWDGVVVGQTDDEGTLNFESPWEFFAHTLLATHTQFQNKSYTVAINDHQPMLIVMVPAVGGDYDEEWQSQQVQGRNEIFGLFSTSLFMGSFVVVASLISGAVYAGLPGALAMGTAVSVMMSLTGIFPWSITVFMVLLAVVFGVPAWRSVLGGGGN